jgi:hypothetical protein
VPAWAIKEMDVAEPFRCAVGILDLNGCQNSGHFCTVLKV